MCVQSLSSLLDFHMVNFANGHLFLFLFSFDPLLGLLSSHLERLNIKFRWSDPSVERLIIIFK